MHGARWSGGLRKSRRQFKSNQVDPASPLTALSMFHSSCEYVLRGYFIRNSKPNAVLVRKSDAISHHSSTANRDPPLTMCRAGGRTVIRVPFGVVGSR